MSLTSIITAKNLLKSRGFQPKKGLGQNFLVDKGVLRDIVVAADLQPDDIVLEIGPGLGALTQELAKKVEKVIAVEKDLNMVGLLEEALKDCNNVEIVHGDILEIQLGWLVDTKCQPLFRYKVVANLPYYIVSPVIRQFLEMPENRSPTFMVLMAQKEVAQRICAKPPDMNLLAVSVQFYARPEIISYVSKKSFWPQPKVDSAIIKIIPRSPVSCLTPGVDGETPGVDGQEIGLPNIVNKNLFFRIVKAGFSSPRKQLVNNLSRGLKLDRQKTENWLSQNDIQPTRRAETLSLGDWTKLAESATI